MNKVGIGIIGCGNISSAYLKAMASFPILDIRGLADMNEQAAKARADEFGLQARSIDALLADPSVEIIVNLTIPKAHVEVGLRALDAGKQQIVIARKGVTPEDPSLLKEIEGHGVTVTSLSQAEHDAFAKVTQPVYDKWKKQIGEDLVNLAEKSIAARKK